MKSTFLKRLNHLEEIVVAGTIGAATLIIFIAVLQRYGLSNLAKLVAFAREAGYADTAAALKSLFLWLASVRLTWAQELCIFLFIWMAKFGAAYGVRTGIHVGVDLVVERAGPTLRRTLILVALLAGALFTAIVGTLGARFVWHMLQSGQTSPSLEVPMWIVYLCLPLGSFLMCFRFLEVAAAFRASGRLPHHEPAFVAGLDGPDGAPAP